MPTPRTPIHPKLVRDAGNRVVGRLATHAPPDVGEATSLLVELDPELAPDRRDPLCRIPLREVASIRRDSMQLAASIDKVLEAAEPRRAPRTT